jgi:transposase
VSLSQVSGCLSCQCEVWPGGLLPHLAGVIVEDAVLAGGRVQVRARPGAAGAACPRCQVSSGRVHSRYERRLADAPIGGWPAVIRLVVRRFFCDSPACGAVTFAEQVAGLTSRRARRTPGLTAMLTAAGLALAGRAGARLAAALGMPASRHSLLRLVMALPGPDPEQPAPAVLGVDDFSFRRGRTYGTLLVDMGTGRPVDLLDGREAATLERWLKGHPGATVICRDRAGAYAEGARAGAPAAVQVADRWHLWHNLAGHVRDEAARHRGCLAAEPPPPAAVPDLLAAAEAAAARRAAGSALGRRTLARHAAVQDLRAQGATVAAAAAALGLSGSTVSRFWQPAAGQDLLATARGRRPSLLDPHKPWLAQRWAEGATSGRQLYRELTARGYPGGYGLVRTYLEAFRAAAPPAPAPPAPPKASEITRWITTRPDNLDDKDKDQLTTARARCPHLDALTRHAAAFARILTSRHGHLLDDWITAADASDLPALHSFTHGLKLDPDAVRNGLTLPWNSGKVEGNVNRLKMLKRQMYGRAGLPLLRKRVLLAT